MSVFVTWLRAKQITRTICCVWLISGEERANHHAEWQSLIWRGRQRETEPAFNLVNITPAAICKGGEERMRDRWKKRERFCCVAATLPSIYVVVYSLHHSELVAHWMRRLSAQYEVKHLQWRPNSRTSGPSKGRCCYSRSINSNFSNVRGSLMLQLMQYSQPYDPPLIDLFLKHWEKIVKNPDFTVLNSILPHQCISLINWCPPKLCFSDEHAKFINFINRVYNKKTTFGNSHCLRIQSRAFGST